MAALMTIFLFFILSSSLLPLCRPNSVVAPAAHEYPGPQENQYRDIAAPPIVKIGVLLDLGTALGQTALQVLHLALRHIQRDPTLLKSTRLSLIPLDTSCSPFQAAAVGVELLKQEVVAIIGPQCSTTAHFLAHMATATQVPLVSFAATDPSLSEKQYTFFFRLAHNDAIQMEAVVAIIQNYGWREVVALYSDDDYGTNGVLALSDVLERLESGVIFQKEALTPGMNTYEIRSMLSKLSMGSSRVFVVHVQQDMAIKVLLEAYNLKMLSTGFVWILTDSLMSSLDMMHRKLAIVKSTQGIIGTRSYTPDSLRLQNLTDEWENLQGKLGLWNELNSYALYSYDSMWLIARVLDRYLKGGGNLAFEDPPVLPFIAGGTSELAKLKIFKGGKVLRKLLLETTYNGTSGLIQFDENGDRLDSSFEIVNMVGRSLRVVSYWSSYMALSTIPPDTLPAAISSLQIDQVLPVIWPGGRTEVPKGWVLPQNDAPLLIGVPKKAGYKELISETVDVMNATIFEGFCINVFETALTYLPYAVDYKFVPYGNDSSTPNYDELIQQLPNKVFDGVVADITITKERLELVDFTQPYAEAGLVVLVPDQTKVSNNVWAFLRPFTPTMWLLTGIFLLFTGAVIWLLEHKVNFDFRGHPQKQLVTALWFIFSTLFFAQREKTRSALGRIVLIIWLFVVLIINSSYTASLTSILTVQQLHPTINGLNSLLETDAPIGYQSGSFVRDYLIRLNVDPRRLIPLSSKVMYGKYLALGPSNGGVAAIIDELPYINLFLATECNYTIAGQKFTKGGWGFAFQKNSHLAVDISEAILTMSRNGELQKIHDLWFNQPPCDPGSNQVQSNILGLDSFWGLFLFSGIASAICILFHIFHLFHRFNSKRYKDKKSPNDESIPQTGSSSQPPQKRRLLLRIISYLRDFASYVDKLDESIDKDTKKKKNKRSESLGKYQAPVVVPCPPIKYDQVEMHFTTHC